MKDTAPKGNSSQIVQFLHSKLFLYTKVLFGSLNVRPYIMVGSYELKPVPSELSYMNALRKILPYETFTFCISPLRVKAGIQHLPGT